MKPVDNIFYDAIQADIALMAAIGGRVRSTCFEVPPYEDDNTPIPNIIITDEGFVSASTTKDTVWESGEDRVQVGVDIAAASPNDVKELVKMVRKAIENYICTMYRDGEDIPQLEPNSPSSDGIAWDWQKPCYYTKLTYQCVIPNDI